MLHVQNRIWSRAVRRLTLAAMSAAMLCVPAAQASQQRPLVLELNGDDKPLTEISINGVQTSALIDTGATIALIDD